MANFHISKELTRDIEGGFFDDPTAGPTYRGITQKYYPYWPGFGRIKLLQQKFFPGRAIPRYTVFNDPVLDQMVSDFYKNNFWNLISGDYIANQHIANFIYDFFVHKQNDAIRVINDAAKVFTANLKTFPTKLSREVLDLINRMPAVYYNTLRQGRINYYKTRPGFSKKNRLAFIERVKRFPATI